MKALKKVAAFVPGPALLFVTQWIGLFSRTPIVHPEWRVEAENFSLGLGVLLVIVLSFILRDWSKKALIKLCVRLFILTLILLAGCWGIWLYLGPPSPGEVAPNPVWWQGTWETLYVLAMAALVATISSGALSIKEGWPISFWILVIVCVLLVMVIGVYMFWPR
jgi:hypothetical protein